jgi:hypothetical protein
MVDGQPHVEEGRGWVDWDLIYTVPQELRRQAAEDLMSLRNEMRWLQWEVSLETFDRASFPAPAALSL